MRNILIAVFLSISCLSWAGEPMIVHEWGTVTSLHLPNGDAIPRANGIGIEDQLPQFVHRNPQLDYFAFGEGTVVKGHPDVVMRLETPVVYFYPGAEHLGKPFDVKVQFNGGFLNEFYPKARLAKIKQGGSRMRLKETSVSHLSWSGIRLVDKGAMLKTGNRVWLAPRQVNSALVQAENGEVEKYLFYRGVAHLPSLMGTRHDLKKQIVTLLPPANMATHKPWWVPSAWIISVRGDKAAFLPLGGFAINADTPNRKINLKKLGEHNSANFKKVRSQVLAALMADGLYEDEAQAMLNTWGHSYFKKAGLRILYIMPKQWAGIHLPISVSMPSQISRTFVGRINLYPTDFKRRKL